VLLFLLSADQHASDAAPFFTWESGRWFSAKPSFQRDPDQLCIDQITCSGIRPGLMKQIRRSRCRVAIALWIRGSWAGFRYAAESTSVTSTSPHRLPSNFSFPRGHALLCPNGAPCYRPSCANTKRPGERPFRTICRLQQFTALVPHKLISFLCITASSAPRRSWVSNAKSLLITDKHLNVTFSIDGHNS